MRQRSRILTVAVVGLALAGCVLPTSKATGARSTERETVVRGTKLPTGVTGKAPTAAPGTATGLADATPGLLDPGTTPDSRTPTLDTSLATTPSLVSDKGSGVIADNGAGVIANNGAGVSGIVRVPAGLVANNGAGYRLLALDAPAAQAEVGLVDADDKLLPGTTWVKTDAAGRYAFAQVPTIGVFYVRARLTANGKTHQLSAIAQVAQAGTVVDVTPASSMVADKTRVVAKEQDLATSTFSPERAKQLAAAAEAALTTATLPDFSQGAEAVSSALDRLIQADDGIEAKARAVDKNVGTPRVRVKQAFANGVVSPEHLAYDRQGNLFVAGLNDHTVYKVAAGSTQAKPFATVRFPHGVTCDAQGNVYVSRRIEDHSPTGDIPGKQVYKISPDGRTVTPLAYTFENPTGLALSRDGKMLYVGQYTNKGQLVAYDLAAGTGSVAATAVPYCWGVAQNSAGLIYATHLRYDATGKAWIGCISTLDAQGKVTVFYAGQKDVTGSDMLEGIAIDAADNLYVSNNWGDTLFKFTPKQKKIETFLKFNQPTGVAFDPQGNLVVADYALGTLSRITP